jgi:hypothetical protein
MSASAGPSAPSTRVPTIVTRTRRVAFARMSETLLHRVAAEVAQRYQIVPLETTAGVLLTSYWDGDASQLAPEALELTAVDEDVGRDGYERGLGAPNLVGDGDLWLRCEELNRQLTGDEDGYALVEMYWLALAGELHKIVRLPVVVDDIEMSAAEQLRRQTDASNPEDELAGMDVLVHVRVDSQQVAAVVMRSGEWMYGFARVGHPDEATPVGPEATELATNPQILAGMLPRGAAGVRVQDRAGTWHPAAVGRGAWLSVLPQRSGQSEPPYVYLDAAGHEFEPGEDAFDEEGLPDLSAHECVVRSGALVAALWPSQRIVEQSLQAGKARANERSSCGSSAARGTCASRPNPRPQHANLRSVSVGSSGTATREPGVERRSCLSRNSLEAWRARP